MYVTHRSTTKWRAEFFHRDMARAFFTRSSFHSEKQSATQAPPISATNREHFNAICAPPKPHASAPPSSPVHLDAICHRQHTDIESILNVPATHHTERCCLVLSVPSVRASTNV